MHNWIAFSLLENELRKKREERRKREGKNIEMPRKWTRDKTHRDRIQNAKIRGNLRITFVDDKNRERRQA